MDRKIRHRFRAEPSWMEFGAANTPTGLPSGAHLHTHLQPSSRCRCHSLGIGIVPPSHSFFGRIAHTFSKKRSDSSLPRVYEDPDELASSNQV